MPSVSLRVVETIIDLVHEPDLKANCKESDLPYRDKPFPPQRRFRRTGYPDFNQRNPIGRPCREGETEWIEN